MFSASWLVKPEGFTYQLTIICNTSSINTHAYSSLVKPDWFTYQLKIFVIPRGYTYQFIIFGNIQRIYSTSQFPVLYSLPNSLHYYTIPKGSYTNLQIWYYLKDYLLSNKTFCNTWRIPSSPFLSTCNRENYYISYAILRGNLFKESHFVKFWYYPFNRDPFLGAQCGKFLALLI